MCLEFQDPVENFGKWPPDQGSAREDFRDSLSLPQERGRSCRFQLSHGESDPDHLVSPISVSMDMARGRKQGVRMCNGVIEVCRFSGRHRDVEVTSTRDRSP